MTTQIPTASELMTRQVKVVSQDSPLIHVIDFLQKHQLSCAPVVQSDDESRVLVGFVSEHDALEQLSNEMFFGRSNPEAPVREWMKRHPITITEDIDLFAIASLFSNYGYRHLPVVEEQDQLLGIVSRFDILKAMRSFYDTEMREHIAEYFPPDVSKIMNHRFIVR